MLTLLLVNNNPQIIRTNVIIKRMKDFVKKIEDLSSLGEDKKAEKVLRNNCMKRKADPTR